MNDSSTMQMLNSTQHLIKQIGNALMVEFHLNNLAQVRVHKLHDQITKSQKNSISFELLIIKFRITLQQTH
jgi:hypothetical protein